MRQIIAQPVDQTDAGGRLSRRTNPIKAPNFDFVGSVQRLQTYIYNAERGTAVADVEMQARILRNETPRYRYAAETPDGNYEGSTSAFPSGLRLLGQISVRKGEGPALTSITVGASRFPTL